MAKDSSQTVLQFRFSKEALERLDDIKIESGCSNRTEVIRNALACYDWIITKNRLGLQIASIDSLTKEVEETLPRM